MPGMYALLDSSDLPRNRGVLAGQNIKAEPCGRGYPAILLVSNDLEQLGRAVTPLRRDNAKLSQVTAARVRQHADGPIASGCIAASGLIFAAPFWPAKKPMDGRVTASQIAAASLGCSYCA